MRMHSVPQDLDEEETMVVPHTTTAEYDCRHYDGQSSCWKHSPSSTAGESPKEKNKDEVKDDPPPCSNAAALLLPTTIMNMIPSPKNPKNKIVSFDNECLFTEYDVDLTPEQRSCLWWDPFELERFRAKRRRKRNSYHYPYHQPVPHQDDCHQYPRPREQGYEEEKEEDMEDYHEMAHPPPNPHFSHARQVVNLYQALQDKEEVMQQRQQPAPDELLQQFSCRWSQRARERAHQRAVALSHSIRVASATTTTPTSSTTYEQAPTLSPPRSSSSSSSSSYNLLPNRFCVVSSRVADFYIESLLESVETNWFCGGVTGAGTWGVQDSRA